MKLLVLDRDGVINEDSDDFIKKPEEWLPIKGSLEAIARLTHNGYYIVVITNQSGIGRGLFSADMLSQIHVRMLDYVHQHGGKIHSILFCPHKPEDKCNCRKPDTGLYDELAARLNVSFDEVFSVGDSIRDLVAAQDAGAKPVLVKTGKGRKSLEAMKSDDTLNDVPVYDSLAKFADALISGELA